jgi:hypothetical protein
MISQTQSHRASLIAALIACAAALAGLSAPAEARDRSSTTTGPNGKGVVRNVTREQGDVSSSTTGANGKAIGSRSVDRSKAGTQAATSGPNGRSVSRTTVPATTPTGTGANTTVTGPNGRTGTVTTTVKP